MSEPLVSIVCESFNHEKYLRQCLDGFVMQKTTFSFEILIHDDASTDKSKDIIREYVARYPEIDWKPIYQTENQYSKGKSIWVSIQYPRAKGKYVAHCECDDYWTDPLKLQKQVIFMEEHKDVGLCITDFCVQADKGKISKPAFANGLFKPQSFEEHLINAGYIGPMTWLIRKSVYDKFSVENGLKDTSLALALNLFAKSKVAYLDDVTAVYRSHSGSATTQADPKKAFQYLNGVFQTQLLYAEKYNCDDKLIERLNMQGYVGHIHAAIEADDMAFVQEALDFYHSKGMEMKWMIEECKRYVRYHQQYEMIRKSKAYKLGKFLLKPLKWLKK